MCFKSHSKMKNLVSFHSIIIIIFQIQFMLRINLKLQQMMQSLILTPQFAVKATVEHILLGCSVLPMLSSYLSTARLSPMSLCPWQTKYNMWYVSV